MIKVQLMPCVVRSLLSIQKVAPFWILLQYCSNFGWRFDMFVNGDISLANNVSLNLFHQSVSESDWLTVRKQTFQPRG